MAHIKRSDIEADRQSKKIGAVESSGRVLWRQALQEHDYPAAQSYLSLLAPADAVMATVERMRHGTVTLYKAKDILRAARLPLLGKKNPHVASDLEKIHTGQALSPILLVRGDISRSRPLQIADGYHRVCACYRTDENTDIPCVVVDL